MAVKELLRQDETGAPGLQIFASCTRLISDLQCLRHDSRNPNDAAREPHGVTHGPGRPCGILHRPIGSPRERRRRGSWRHTEGRCGDEEVGEGCGVERVKTVPYVWFIICT